MNRSTACRITGIALVITVTVVAIGIILSDPSQPKGAPRFFDNVPMSVSPTHTVGVVGEKTQVCAASRYAAEHSTHALLLGGKVPVAATIGPPKDNVSTLNSARTVDNGIVWYESTSQTKTLCAFFIAPEQGTYQVAFMKGDEILRIENFASVIPPS